MKISYSWLQDWLELDETPEQVADILTLAGLEVDKVEPIPFSFSGVIIGKVLTASPHPDADKLQIATVFDGEQEWQVVCGAKNCRAGLITAFARLGATLCDDKGDSFTIKKCKLRGVESSGMLCAEDELGLALKSAGIVEFPESAPIGMPLEQYLGDTIFEISLTPNLGHCTSHLGIARELAAQLNRSVKGVHNALSEIEEPLNFEAHVSNFQECPRYMIRKLTDVRVGPSPEWLVRRLEMCGMRSINNVVDVTNYVMLELGQPMHAFDLDKLPEKKLSVRTSSKSHTLVTLDGQTREIPPGILLIQSGGETVALAGLMGGESSAVSESTTSISLEAAFFNSTSIRKSMKTLGFRSESAGRFEKGIDPNMIPFALDRAAKLLQEIAGAKVCQGVLDVKEGTFPCREIPLRCARINQLLGCHLSQNEVSSLLKRLSFLPKEQGSDNFIVSVPTFRNDVKEEIDLIEEVARVYGYNNLQKREPCVSISRLSHSPLFLFEKRLRQRLVSEGLQEFLTCDLISPKQALVGLEGSLNSSALIEVLYPSSVDQSVLRASLLPGHLQAIKHNFDQRTFDISAFEVGAIHFKEKDRFLEPHVMAVTLCGRKAPHHYSGKPPAYDFFDLKGILDNLFDSFHITNVTYQPSQLKSFHPNCQAMIYVGQTHVGTLGQVHPDLTRQFDIEVPVYFAETKLDDVMACMPKSYMMQPLPLYPSSQRDWTISLNKRTHFSQLQEAVASFQSPYIKHPVELRDLFEKGEGKNVTIRLTYRDDEATIEATHVENLHGKLTERVSAKLSDALIEQNS